MGTLKHLLKKNTFLVNSVKLEAIGTKSNSKRK